MKIVLAKRPRYQRTKLYQIRDDNRNSDFLSSFSFTYHSTVRIAFSIVPQCVFD